MTNEFTGKPKEFLNALKDNLESYEKGTRDALNVIIECLEDIRKKTSNLYARQIAQLQEELNK